jgi:hypothetical protein
MSESSISDGLVNSNSDNILDSLTKNTSVSTHSSSGNLLDSIGEPSVSSSSSGSISINTLLWWIMVIFILAILGINIFKYLAKGTEEVNSFIKPLVDVTLAIFAYISSSIVELVAAGSKAIIGGTAKVLDKGLSEIEDTAEKIADKTDPANLKKMAQEKKQQNSNDSDDDNDSVMNNNPLNNQLNNKVNPITMGSYEADDSNSTIQQASGKAGWCLIGEDRGYRSCVEVGKSDTCMSGDIFPSKDICVNPSLRAG